MYGAEMWGIEKIQKESNKIHGGGVLWKSYAAKGMAKLKIQRGKVMKMMVKDLKFKKKDVMIHKGRICCISPWHEMELDECIECSTRNKR